MLSGSPQLLSLLRLTSPALPIGAYAYSRGLEHAVHAGWVHDEASARDWIVGLTGHAIARLDAPLFLRMHDAWSEGRFDTVEHDNALLHASRESEELRLEDVQLGAAFAKLLVSLGVTRASAWLARADACHATLFALAAVHYEIPKQDALLGYLWSLAEGQTSAAVRLVPLGQTSGQRILSALIEALPKCAALAFATSVAGDDALGAAAPAFAIGSALHETQYTRLFRS